jgi:hypothetical protein
MTLLINNVDAKFTGVARSYPEFQGKKILSLQGSTHWQDSAIAARPSWKTEWLTQMGCIIPAEIDAFGQPNDNRAYIPLDQIGPVLGVADVLLWSTEGDDDVAALLANPAVAAFQNRNVFTNKEQAGAIAFTSPLSFRWWLTSCRQCWPRHSCSAVFPHRLSSMPAADGRAVWCRTAPSRLPSNLYRRRSRLREMTLSLRTAVDSQVSTHFLTNHCT